MMEHLKIEIDLERKHVVVRHTERQAIQTFLLEDVKRLTYSFMKAWADALESGEYEQCTGGLVGDFNGTNRYCCLGVAVVCRNYSPNILISKGHLHDQDLQDKLMRLPKVMRESSRLNNSFAHLNDAMSLNFKEIAYVIREMYKQVNLLNGDYPDGTAIN